MRAWAIMPPHDLHTANVLKWPDYVSAPLQRDALWDRRMAVKSGLPYLQWLKAFGRVYATHHRHWIKACTVIALAVTSFRLAQA